MRFVPIKLLKDGMKVGRTIYNEKGIPLLYANASLNNNHIAKLIELGYQGLLIDDDISKNIEDIVTKVLSSRDLTLNLLELKMFDNLRGYCV